MSAATQHRPAPIILPSPLARNSSPFGRRSFIPQGCVFFPETLDAMQGALHDAWQQVQQSGYACCTARFAAETRTQLARRIFEGAAAGEQCRIRLATEAVASLFPLLLLSDGTV